MQQEWQKIDKTQRINDISIIQISKQWYRHETTMILPAFDYEIGMVLINDVRSCTCYTFVSSSTMR